MLGDLFWSFLRIGLFTFGGGYAMLPMIEHTCVETKQWITSEDMMNITVIAESTPGPVAINCATFVGYKNRGWLGAIAATVGMMLPSLVIICLIARFLDNFLEITVIAHAFRGIKLAVGLLIVDAARKMFRKMPKTPVTYGIFGISAASMLLISVFAWNFSTIALMLIFGAASLVLYAFYERRMEARR